MKKFKGCLNCKYRGEYIINRTFDVEEEEKFFICQIDEKEIKKDRVFCKYIDSLGKLKPVGKRKLMRRVL